MKQLPNHTRLSVFIIVPALIFMTYLSVRHWSDPNENWGQFAFYFQLIPGLVGFFGYQILKKETIFPTQYGNFHEDLLMRVGVMFVAVYVVQLVAQLSLDITDLEYAFYVCFAAPLEEIFFRGFCITAIVMIFTAMSPKLLILGRIVAIGVTSFVFASLHFSYYGHWDFLLAVFLSGVVFGIAFAWWGDITANIFAHFLWNFALTLMANLDNTIVWLTLLIVFAALILLSFVGKKKKNVRIKRYNVTVSKYKYGKLKK